MRYVDMEFTTLHPAPHTQNHTDTPQLSRSQISRRIIIKDIRELLVDKGLTATTRRATIALNKGEVYVNGCRVANIGTVILPCGVDITCEGVTKFVEP